MRILVLKKEILTFNLFSLQNRIFVGDFLRELENFGSEDRPVELRN